MRSKVLALALIGCLLGVGQPVFAAPSGAMSAATIHNVQCFIATSTLSASSDKSQSSAGLMGAIFFAGKIFGSDPNVDLTAAVRAQSSKLTQNQINSLLAECGTEMKARGNEITAAGQALQAPGDAPNP